MSHELSPNLWQPQKIVDKETGSDVSILLKPFFTNSDRPVFVMRNLPPLTEGALFSRFSRAEAPDIRQVFYDEFLSQEVKADFRKDPGKVEEEINDFMRLQSYFVNEARAKSFYRRVLAEYGDDSIGYMTSAHLAMLHISSRASFETSEQRIGADPIVKSSRFLVLDKKINGKYQYYRDPQIMQSRFADQFINAMDLLFDTYSRMLPEMIKFLKEKVPLHDFRSRGISLADAEKTRDQSKVTSFVETYENSARSAALDVIRGLLPSAVLLNKGFSGNAGGYKSILLRLLTSQLYEFRTLGRESKSELDLSIPEVLPGIDDEHGIVHQKYLKETKNALRIKIREAFNRYGSDETAKPLWQGRYVSLIDVDDNERAELNVFSALIADEYQVDTFVARNLAAKLTQEKKEEMINEVTSRRTNRRHKLQRGFENAHYTFQFMMPLGELRDLHRHKMQTRSMPPLTVKNGFDVPEEVVAIGAKKEYSEPVKGAEEVYWALFDTLPAQADYAVTFAHKLPYRTTVNLRATDVIATLRSSSDNNPRNRVAAQEMHQAVSYATPTLAKAMNLVDFNEYELGRFWSLYRSEEKKSKLQ